MKQSLWAAECDWPVLVISLPGSRLGTVVPPLAPREGAGHIPSCRQMGYLAAEATEIHYGAHRAPHTVWMVFLIQKYLSIINKYDAFSWCLSSKESACHARDRLQCRRLGFSPWVRKSPPEEGMATHSSLLAWRIPKSEEPGGYSPCCCQRVRHDLTTKPTNKRRYDAPSPGQ